MHPTHSFLPYLGLKSHFFSQSFLKSVSLMAFFFDLSGFCVFIGRFICFCMRKSLGNTYFEPLYIEVVKFFGVNFGFGFQQGDLVV